MDNFDLKKYLTEGKIYEEDNLLFTPKETKELENYANDIAVSLSDRFSRKDIENKSTMDSEINIILKNSIYFDSKEFNEILKKYSKDEVNKYLKEKIFDIFKNKSNPLLYPKFQFNRNIVDKRSPPLVQIEDLANSALDWIAFNISPFKWGDKEIITKAIDKYIEKYNVKNPKNILVNRYPFAQRHKYWQKSKKGKYKPKFSDSLEDENYDPFPRRIGKYSGSDWSEKENSYARDFERLIFSKLDQALKSKENAVTGDIKYKTQKTYTSYMDDNGGFRDEIEINRFK